MSFMKQENPDFYMDSNNISSSNSGDGNHGEYNHPSGQTAQNTITAFLAKLWALVNDSSCDDLIAWDPSGGSFHVYDQSRFSREILPRYFKHNNFASFIRQLNMYGFRKISNIEHGSLKNERDDIEFAHPNFIRGQESLLESIKRRAPEPQLKSNMQGGPNASSALVSADYLDSKSGRSLEFSHLIHDVRSLQAKQTSLNDKLSYMQSENQALWGEIGSLRQKHGKQQHIVSKLMEFLLQFISANSVHHSEQSVEQQSTKEGLTTDSTHPNQAHGQHHGNNSPLVFSDQDTSPASLKRKHVALMHTEEPNKRIHTHQQEQQQHVSHPTNLGRQQSVTINELTDNDTSGWHHATNASPLVDLVPSPPPSIHTADDHYHQQQQQQQGNDYRWSSEKKDHIPQNQTFQPVGNGNNARNTFAPDFYLRTDNSAGVNPNNGQANGVNPTGTKTSQANASNQVQIPTTLKQELIDYSNKCEQNPSHPQPTEQLSFSLDDITGDVDHIQSSLDNIRDLMFDNLPDGTSIEDLFGADNDLLSPLLHSTSTNDQTPNLLLENMKDQKVLTAENSSNDITNLTTSQSVPNVNNQLLEQLMTENAKIEQQQNTINQLEHKTSLLENKIHTLEQQIKK
ncbi:hypothetical protein I4U23_029017 [Adineta vaga]|nr:hypothetical protein I4U23_029017 [Adineta vaga]